MKLEESETLRKQAACGKEGTIPAGRVTAASEPKRDTSILQSNPRPFYIAHKLTSEKKTPDLLDYIYFDGLNTIKPGSVNIIR